MNKIILILFLILPCQVFSQNDEDVRNGIDFNGLGSDPFWEVKIDIDKMITFYSATDNIKTEIENPKKVEMVDSTDYSFVGENDYYHIWIVISKEDCTYGNLDIIYPYSIKLYLRDYATGKPKSYIGCGKFAADLGLGSKWYLEKINGINVPIRNIKLNNPFIEFNIDDEKVSGNSGCNTFSSNASVKGDKIYFSNQIVSTLMACPDMSIEKEFLSYITGRIITYRFENQKLLFIENDHVIMEFGK